MRFREEGGVDAVEGLSFEFRAHDLRRTAPSFMGEAGVDRFHIAHVLNHRSVTHSTVTSIYDRYRYDREKRQALEVWAGALARVVGGKPERVHERRISSTPELFDPSVLACPVSS